MGFFSSKKEEKKAAVVPAPAPSNIPAVPAAPVTTSAPTDSISDLGKLTPPSIPGVSHLDDIKSEVINANNGENIPVSNIETESNTMSLNGDSLFDLSDLDLESDIPNSESESNSLKDSVNFENTAIDPENENLSSLNFTSRSTISKSKDEDIFVTTSQFKTLLSIIDSVKSRVKDATETHLRLMDIKSEEDIEYENLRKAFQFVEDKLYEVDNLIFEK